MNLCLGIIFLAETNALTFALRECTLTGLVIGGLLVLLSALSWAIMMSKFAMLRNAVKQNDVFLESFRDSETPLTLYEQGAKIDGAPLYAVYRAGAKEIAFYALGSTEVRRAIDPKRGGAMTVSPSQMQGVNTAMERAVGEATLRVEGRLSLLAALVKSAPYLGLLGTVWGIMAAFAGAVESGGAANLQTMAPGISAALVTVIVALLVAVPALFGHQFLMNNIRRLVVQLDNFAAELSSAFERRYVDHLGVLSYARPTLMAMGEGIRERQGNLRRSDLGGAAARELQEPGEGANDPEKDQEEHHGDDDAKDDAKDEDDGQGDPVSDQLNVDPRDEEAGKTRKKKSSSTS